MRIAVVVGLVLVVAGLVYVRFAPSDPDQWHVAVEGDADADYPGGALRVVSAEPATFEAADAYMQALPRTQVLAGSVEAGRVTYVTRTRVIGFPDYTTLEYADGTLKAFARLRFGQSDLGVNRERLEGLLAAIQR